MFIYIKKKVKLCKLLLEMNMEMFCSCECSAFSLINNLSWIRDLAIKLCSCNLTGLRQSVSSNEFSRQNVILRHLS